MSRIVSPDDYFRAMMEYTFEGEMYQAATFAELVDLIVAALDHEADRNEIAGGFAGIIGKQCGVFQWMECTEMRVNDFGQGVAVYERDRILPPECASIFEAPDEPVVRVSLMEGDLEEVVETLGELRGLKDRIRVRIPPDGLQRAREAFEKGQRVTVAMQAQR